MSDHIFEQGPPELIRGPSKSKEARSSSKSAIVGDQPSKTKSARKPRTPEQKAANRECGRRYRERLRATEEGRARLREEGRCRRAKVEYKLLQREQGRKRRARLNATEEGRAKLRERRRRYREQVKSNPERNARFKAQQAAYIKQRYENEDWHREALERGRRRYASIPREQHRAWNRAWVEKNADRARENWRRNHAKRKLKRKVRIQLSSADALRGLAKLIPAYLPRHIRDDVLSDVTLAMLEGRCTPDKLRATIKQAATRYNAALWQELSLDAPVPGMDGVTYLDCLAAGET